MFELKSIEEISKNYIKELKEMGRQFNPIKVKIKSRKSISNFGKAKHTFERFGYDTIEINQYIVEEGELRNTILHELAHLDLYARGHGHGRRWQVVASIYGRKFNMNLSRTSDKEIKVPGQITVRVTWTDEFYKYNPSFPRGEAYERKYSSIGYAKRFVSKYEKSGFIASKQFIRG